MKYKKGTLLIFTTGDYSNYGIEAVCRVLKDFTQEEVGDPFLKTVKRDDIWGLFFRESFVNFLATKGYIEEVQYEEWCYTSDNEKINFHNGKR